jgi:hypothetical protein
MIEDLVDRGAIYNIEQFGKCFAESKCHYEACMELWSRGRHY